MRISRLIINNFRSIKTADLLFPDNVVLVGDNNSGKSTILEAIDLVLGPERIKQRPVVNEHDFFGGIYLGEDDESPPVEIRIEATVTDLNEEQEERFVDNLEFWNESEKCLLAGPPAGQTDEEHISSALRVLFIGHYDPEEDDFVGDTYCASPEGENGELVRFGTRDKRFCGFLFLRTLRTGSRALSLERGSLLDIILRLREQRVEMWEDVIDFLRQEGIAEDEELGLSQTLTEVQAKLRSFIPTEWADDPRIRVSDLTRESLRKVLTVFMAAGMGADSYAVPFRRQGTGTVNMLVFALLSMIADEKQNVIFAMEEPEIAIPPYTQKRVVDSIRNSASQVLITSHSPFVLEEFPPSHIVVIERASGNLSITPASLPPAVKQKAYQQEMRTRFAEALLARRVLIVEGRTEYDAMPAAARRLSNLSDEYRSFDSLGIAVVDARTDSQVKPLVEYFESLGKKTFAVFDKQDAGSMLSDDIEHAFESPEKGFERLLAKHSDIGVIHRYLEQVNASGDWPLPNDSPPDDTNSENEVRKLFENILRKSKGSGEAAEFVSLCDEAEMPKFVVDTIQEIISITSDGAGGPDDSAEEE